MLRAIWDDSMDDLLCDVEAAPSRSLSPDECRWVDARVLIVDDNAISQLVTLQQLRALACFPETASSGAAALEITMREHFDLILLDCRMPDVDGYATARAIRERESSSTRFRTAIVAITGDGDIECVDKCLAAGMDGHLAKPTSVPALRAILKRFLT